MDRTEIRLRLSGPRPIAVIHVAESLDRFFTIAFGIEIMRGCIRRGPFGLIEAGAWLLSTVPEVYREQVAPMLDVVVAMHRGRKLTDDLVRQFVDDLNREISARLEPIRP